MTASLLAFNIVSPISLFIGSRNEQNRLRDAYGEKYDEYLNSRVPFYVPDIKRVVIGTMSLLRKIEG